MKKVLIIGANSQDGFYLAKHLNILNFEIYGSTRNIIRANNRNHRLQEFCKLIEIDPNNYLEINDLIKRLKPDFIFVLAAESSVSMSFYEPHKSLSANSSIALNVLEAVRKNAPCSRIMNSCSSEVFGNCTNLVTSETPFNPVSPYGYSKAVSADYARLYREIYGVYVVNLFLFNHESPLRPDHFVTRKVIDYVKSLHEGNTNQKLKLGNLDVKRDWGLAKEYVVAMYKSVQQKVPEDCVICTGEQITLKKFVERAFLYHGFKAEAFIEIDPTFLRKNELFGSLGDIKEAINKLDWRADTIGLSVIDSLFAND